MLTVDRCLLQGGKFFTGHWFYSLWNTALLVQKTGDDGLQTKEDPVLHLSPKHIFRASDHDNEEWNQVQHGPFGNTQSLQAINKWVQHAKPRAHASLSLSPPLPSFLCIPFPWPPLFLMISTIPWHLSCCAPFQFCPAHFSLVAPFLPICDLCCD